MKNNILWFEKPSRNDVIEVRFSDEGMISFSAAARRALPSNIRLGFCTDSRKIRVEKSLNKRGLNVTAPVPKALPPLTRKMYACKIPFPCRFVLSSRPENPEEWEGELEDFTEQNLIKEIKNTAHKNTVAARQSEAMQRLVEKYHEKLKRQCYSTAKTIDCKDRMSIAIEGFMSSVLSYKANLQEFEEYSMKYTKNFLESNIPKYAGTYKEFYSLYQTSADGSEYEVFEDKHVDADFESILFNADLAEKASPAAYDVAAMLSEGYTKDEIMDEMKISDKRYELLHCELREILKELYPEMNDEEH